MINSIADQSSVIAVGIDLAWQYRNSTGIAVLRYGLDGVARLIGEPVNVTPDDLILALLTPFNQTETLIVGIDAPLRVPNASHGRAAETSLARVFSRYQASAYPVNRSLLARNGIIRGESLVGRLGEQLRIRHSATLIPRQPTRQVFEIYPHTAQVALFGLVQTLKYKRRPGRSNAERRAAFEVYRAGLRALRHNVPALEIDSPLMTDDPSHLLDKKAEDRLDALMCAYIALYYWYWGTEKCYIFGDPVNNYERGYIVTPVDARTDPRRV